MFRCKRHHLFLLSLALSVACAQDAASPAANHDTGKADTLDGETDDCTVTVVADETQYFTLNFEEFSVHRSFANVEFEDVSFKETQATLYLFEDESFTVEERSTDRLAVDFVFPSFDPNSTGASARLVATDWIEREGEGSYVAGDINFTTEDGMTLGDYPSVEASASCFAAASDDGE